MTIRRRYYLLAIPILAFLLVHNLGGSLKRSDVVEERVLPQRSWTGDYSLVRRQVIGDPSDNSTITDTDTDTASTATPSDDPPLPTTTGTPTEATTTIETATSTSTTESSSRSKKVKSSTFSTPVVTIVITENGSTISSQVLGTPVPQDSGSDRDSGPSSKTWIIIGSVVGGVVVLAGALFIIFRLTQKRFSSLDDDDGAAIKWPELIRDGDQSTLNPMVARRREGAGVEMSEVGSQRGSFDDSFGGSSKGAGAMDLNRNQSTMSHGGMMGYPPNHIGQPYYDDPNQAFYDPYIAPGAAPPAGYPAQIYRNGPSPPPGQQPYPVQPQYVPAPNAAAYDPHDRAGAASPAQSLQGFHSARSSIVNAPTGQATGYGGPGGYHMNDGFSNVEYIGGQGGAPVPVQGMGDGRKTPQMR